MKSKQLLAGAALLVGLGGASVDAASLVYQYNFDNQPATATTAVPNVGANGVLGMNTTGLFAPLATGVGPSGLPTDRALVNTGVNNTPTGSSLTGSNSAANGSVNNGTTNIGQGVNTSATPANLLNIGSVNQFTVTMWVRRTTPAVNPTAFGRLMIVGSDGQDTGSTSDGFVVALNNSAIEVRGRNQGGNVTGVGGQTFTDNTWQFLAVSYNLANSNPFFDPVQTVNSGSGVYDPITGTATSGVIANNTVVYRGTDTTPATYYGSIGVNLPSTTLNLSNAYAYFLNRKDLTRGLNGNGDDFRIYSGLLTRAEVEAIRLENAAVVPEPASLGLLSIAAATLVRRRRA